MDKLNSSLQENIITLLCFFDDQAVFIRNSVELELFDSSIYRDIAKQAIDYIDKFEKAPNDHIADLLEDRLTDKNKKKARLYEDILHNLYGLKEGLNVEYVLSQLTTFIRQQKLKAGITEAVKAVKNGDLDAAENVLGAAMKYDLHAFEPGTFFDDSANSLGFLNHLDSGYLTGISEIDKRGLGPARKELQVYIGPPKSGKTWYLVHLGKLGAMQELKVLHVTLEMSETKMLQRYYQSFFSITKRQVKDLPVTVLKKDDAGSLIEIDSDYLNRPAFEDPDIKKLLRSKIGAFGKQFKILVKQFPTGQLTIQGLKVYLDTLERSHSFVADLLIVDYADLMKIDSSNVRADTGRIYKDLRGIAVERNIAVVTASQSNRAALDAKIITDAHFAEDYSKAAIADMVMSYNQTQHERRLGLARLFVALGRNDEDKFSILISQSYAMGQFCIDSVFMKEAYWEQIDESEPEDGGDD